MLMQLIITVSIFATVSAVKLYSIKDHYKTDSDVTV